MQTVELVQAVHVVGQSVHIFVVILGYCWAGHIEEHVWLPELPNCPGGQLIAYTQVIDESSAKVPVGQVPRQAPKER